MNSANTKKKQLSEYQLDDIKIFFSDVLKKISSKVILIEIGSDFLNIGLAKSQNNKLFIKKIFRQKLPKEALDKSLPTDPVNFGIFLNQIINENKINTNRVAISLPSDACYTRLIDIPEEINEDESINFLDNPDSGIQIPISLSNSDFDVKLTNLPNKELNNKIFNKYFLTSIPKKNIDLILESIKTANLEICSIQMSHMCIANLLRTEIDKLNENELIISVDLLDEFSQLVIFDNTGPLLIKRLASIRNYPTIEELKRLNEDKSKTKNNFENKSKTNNYHALSKLDLKVLLREIKGTITDFLHSNNLIKTGKIFLSGRNSQHKNLVEIIGKSLKIDVNLISPINNHCLKEFSYNPDEINQFSMSRLVGLGLTLIKDVELENESLNENFIIQRFLFKDDINPDNKNSDFLKDSKQEKNIKIKDNAEAKTSTKAEDKKKELPSLPNFKKGKDKDINEPSVENAAKLKKQKKELEIKKNKSFKMDKSFLKND